MGATVDTKMTAIADEIRVLSGVEGKLGLDAIAENVSDANDKVSAQVSLISELKLALSGKAIDSGETVIRELTVVENGTYSAPVGVDGYSPVVVNVPAPALQSKKVYGIGSTETITADDGYDGLSDVTIYQTVNTPAMPVIGVSPELGQITATVTETGGYVKGTETRIMNLGTVGFGGVTITPTTEEQTIATVGKLVAGEIKVAGDVNLIPANIVSGVNIFGVAGTATSSGSDGSGSPSGDAVGLPALITPASAGDIAEGKQAIDGDGNVVEGTVSVIDGEYYMDEVDLYQTGDDFYIEHYPENDILVRSGSSVIAQWTGSDFGDATAADVAVGKTFTSAAGLKVTGTASASGDEEIYFSDMGQLYKPHMVIPEGNMRYVRDHFSGAVHLVSFIQQYGTPASDSDYGLFRGCTALETVWVSRATFGAYFFSSCSALKTITLGRVGLAVTSLNAGMWDYTVKNVETITCYVNATTLADIPTAVSGRILPSASPNAVVTYRNSTTGEIITV